MYIAQIAQWIFQLALPKTNGITTSAYPRLSWSFFLKRALRAVRGYTIKTKQTYNIAYTRILRTLNDEPYDIKDSFFKNYVYFFQKSLVSCSALRFIEIAHGNDGAKTASMLLLSRLREKNSKLLAMKDKQFQGRPAATHRLPRFSCLYLNCWPFGPFLKKKTKVAYSLHI